MIFKWLGFSKNEAQRSRLSPVGGVWDADLSA